MKASLKEIIDFVKDNYNIDLKTKDRKRYNVYAKKVYCNIANKLGYTHIEIGNAIDTTHCMSLFHSKSINVITDREKKMYDAIVSKFNLGFDKLFHIDKKKSINRVLIKEVFSIMNEWEGEEIKTFIDTRLKPYNLMINNNKTQLNEKKEGSRIE